jgi:RNA polymerase sigma-70 factor (ECF subfamily)
MQEDMSLMADFKAGSHESFERIMLMYRVKAISFAMGYVHDEYWAEDIVQESFADAFVYRDRYKVKYSFKTYLFTIIKNKCIDYSRKRHNVPIDDLQLISEDNPEQQVMDLEERSMLKRKFGELKKDYQTAIYLIEYENFSYEEAARIMGRNLGQMKILIYRARKKLKVLLEREV